MTSIRRLFAPRLFTLALLASMALGLVGCDAGDTRSAAEIKADVVASLLKGMKRQGSQFSAERFDADAQELRAVRVIGDKGLLYAERATITVDEMTRAVRIKLFDVVVTQPIGEADESPEGTQGRIVRYPEMVLDDIAAPPRE